MKADLENGPDSWEPEGGFDSNGVPVTWYEALYALPTEPMNYATREEKDPLDLYLGGKH